MDNFLCIDGMPIEHLAALDDALTALLGEYSAGGDCLYLATLDALPETTRVALDHYHLLALDEA